MREREREIGQMKNCIGQSRDRRKYAREEAERGRGRGTDPGGAEEICNALQLAMECHPNFEPSGIAANSHSIGAAGRKTWFKQGVTSQTQKSKSKIEAHTTHRNSRSRLYSQKRNWLLHENPSQIQLNAAVCTRLGRDLDHESPRCFQERRERERSREGGRDRDLD